MAQGLRALVLAEDPVLIPSTRRLIAVHSSSPRHGHGTQTFTQAKQFNMQ